MDSSISECVKELKNINVEMSRLREQYRDQVKKLKPRKLQLENKIQTYLEENDKEGLKYGSTVILLTERKERREKPKKQNEKIEVSSQVLSRYGIENTKQAANELLEALRGRVYKVPCLKMKQIKFDYF